MNLTAHTVPLAELNTLTKYPSIETYHRLDPANGGLTDDLNVGLLGDVVLTEKIDGTNARTLRVRKVQAA